MVQDRILTCTSCGTRFVWTAADPAGGQPAICPGCRAVLPAPGRQRGVVKFYSVRKKWGFIVQPDGREVFFHRSAWPSEGDQALHEGDLVEYAVEATARGPQAVELALLQTGRPVNQEARG
jgi:cold shock CspA family protein